MYTYSTSNARRHDPATRATEEQKGDKKKYLSLRKRLRRQAEAKHHRPTKWYGGILYFTDSRFTLFEGSTFSEVPGVQHIPKPDRKVIGYSGAHPPRVFQSRADRKISRGW